MKDNIKIYNCDCMKLMKKFPDEYIDLIVTDPPYKTTSRGGHGNSGGMCKKKEFNSGKVFKYNDISSKEFLPEFYRILKDGTHCYVMSNHKNLQEMINVGVECGFQFVKCLIWDKGNKIMGQFYMSQFEYIIMFRKGKARKINNCGTSDILSIPNKKTKADDGTNLHDTEKPIQLMKILIENSSNENEIVLDPFLGIGASALACIINNRKFIGIELDEKYYNIAKERINNYEDDK